MKINSLLRFIISGVLVIIIGTSFPEGSLESVRAETPISQTTPAFAEYKPSQKVILAHETNYGDRYATDARGNRLSNPPLVVLHETVGSASSAINLFKTPHYRDEEQVSYHTLITLDGTIIYIVPPEKRAFGASNSVFNSPLGRETVQTNPNLSPSVNNFSYHISLETPPDGRNNRPKHSGYSNSQYKSLAWLLVRSNVPGDRITTHQDVDLSGTRFDPRSFDFNRLSQVLQTYRQPIQKPV